MARFFGGALSKRYFAFCDFILIVVSIYVVIGFDFFRHYPVEYLALLALVSGCVLLTVMVMGLYRHDGTVMPHFPLRIMVAVLAAFAVGWIVAGHVNELKAVRVGAASALALSVVGMFVWRIAAHRFSQTAAAARSVVIVAPQDAIDVLVRMLGQSTMRTVATLSQDPENGRISQYDRTRLLRLASEGRITDIVLSDAFSFDPEISDTLATGRSTGLRVSSLTKFMAAELGRLPLTVNETQRELVFAFRGRVLTARIIKRGLDIVCSLLLLILAAPVMAVTAILIRREDGGPVFYRQVRTGRDRRDFTMLKFRSMRVDAEKDGCVQWARVGDNRATRIGHFLRRSRIDELPQLFNVLSGEMSLVGPRPERPEIVASLREQIPLYDLRHLVSPGVTGWAQINFPYGASLEDATEKTRYDLYYVCNCGPLLDLRITLETIRVVLFAHGSR